MNRLNGGRSLSHGGCHSFDGAAAYVTRRKDTGPAGLEIVRRPLCCPFGAGIGAGQHKPILIQGDAIAKPSGTGLSAKKQENVPDGFMFNLSLPVPLYGLESRFAA